jgi:FkbM family methyltransferase
MKARLFAQAKIKSMARIFGLEVRYSFQNRPITDATTYGRFTDPKVIFDVGANIGSVAKASQFPNAKIYSFEPFPAPFNLLKMRSLKCPSIKPVQLALGQTELAITTGVSITSSSPLNKISPGKAGAKITVTTIDNFCSANHIETIDILKTDTEGHDAHVLKGATQMLAENKICCIMSEVGFIQDYSHTLFEDIFDLLRPCGYQFAGLFETTFDRSGKCNFANALFALPIGASKSDRYRG